MAPTVALVTFTRNSREGLRRLLTQVAPLVDEVVVVDGFSTDGTAEVAESFGAKVYRRRPWGHVEPDRMFALRQVRSDWVLYLDADELLCPGLAKELRPSVEGAEADGLWLRRVELLGRRPAAVTLQLRLYKRDRAVYKGLVHELPEIRGRTSELPPECCIAHLSSWRESWRKMPFYARLEALEYYEHKTRSKVGRILRRTAPLSSAALVLHYIARGALKGQVFNLESLGLLALQGLYDSLVHTHMKIRDEERRRRARLIQERGLIQLLGL